MRANLDWVTADLAVGGDLDDDIGIGVPQLQNHRRDLGFCA
jgi:hypothetical protein